MFPYWALLAIGAAFLWAIVNNVDKYVITRLVEKPIIPVLILGLTQLVIAAILLIHVNFNAISFPALIAMLLAGTFQIGMNYFYFKAIQLGEIGRLIPLFYLSPIFILLLSPFIIGVEALTLQNYIGVLLLVGGAILISMENGLKISFNKPFQYMIAGTLSLALNQILTKYATQQYDFTIVFGFVRLGAGITTLILLIRYWKDLRAFVTRKSILPTVLLTISNGVDLFAIGILTMALYSGPVSLTNALASIQPFFVLLLTIVFSLFFPHILRENMQKKIIITKFLAILLIFGGSLLVI